MCVCRLRALLSTANNFRVASVSRFGGSEVAQGLPVYVCVLAGFSFDHPPGSGASVYPPFVSFCLFFRTGVAFCFFVLSLQGKSLSVPGRSDPVMLARGSWER